MSMSRFQILTAIAAPLPQANIDTDQIVPKQFLTTVERDGLAGALFYDLRFDADGRPRAQFALNQARHAGCGVIVAGANFGCGSSREHAVWALQQYGVRCVIAESFGEIFEANCYKNGLLPLTLALADVDRLMSLAEEGATFTVDLPSQTIAAGDIFIRFGIDADRKRNLVEGLDEIGATLLLEATIAAFERDRRSP